MIGLGFGEVPSPIIAASGVLHDPFLDAIIVALASQLVQGWQTFRNRRDVKHIRRQVTPTDTAQTAADEWSEIRRSQAGLARAMGSLENRFAGHLRQHDREENDR